MSVAHAFFSQRKKEKEEGKPPSSDTAIAAKLFGAPEAVAAPAKRTFHVAVQGCCHGELARIYAACAEHERETHRKIDLLICCGDFQSTRSYADLASMAVPDKYKVVGDFPTYYAPVPDNVHLTGSGGGAPAPPPAAAAAPYLTLFVGGNHENSDWLAEESYGGFLAPNIYYLGHSGVVEVDGGLRVGGLSGIFKSGDYDRPYPERRPYATGGEGGKRSAYHIRRIEQEKLRCYTLAREIIRAGRLEQRRQQGQERQGGQAGAPAPSSSSSTTTATTTAAVDVMVSHDWPAGITRYGDEEQLLRYKPYFREEVANNALGNPHTLGLLRTMRPQHWLAAHLHCFFTANVQHALRGDDAATAFMALDKCAKGKGFLDFIDIPILATRADDDGGDTAASATGPGAPYHTRVQRDAVWVEVLRRSHPFLTANYISSGSDSSAGGFNAEREAAAIAAAFLDGVGGGPEDHHRAVLFAPTTAAALRAMGLPPAAPLQLPLTAAPPRSGGAAPPPPQQQQRGRHPHPSRGPQYQRAPAAVEGYVPPAHRRRLHAEAPGTVPPPAQERAEEQEPLGWVEDLG